MKCRILHETRNRLRIRILKPCLSMAEAEILERSLSGNSFIKKARVDERTKDAVILFEEGKREELISLLSGFSFDWDEKEEIDIRGRALQRDFERKLAFHVAKRGVTRFLMPLPGRKALTLYKSIPFIREAMRSLKRGKLEVSVLDAAGIVTSMALGDFDTAGSVMFLLGVGDIMEEWTHKKSVSDLARAMSLNVDKVWVKTPSGGDILLNVSDVKEGERIIVRKGGVIPLDGEIVTGDAMVNQASITGEPLPVEKKRGSYVYGGTVVEDGEILVQVKKASGSGQYDRIINMIEESEKLKSQVEDKAARMADKLVPYTFLATLAAWIITRDITRASAILMVDFSCALKLSVPLSVLSAMKEASSYGISVKGGKFLEAIAGADTVVFDKTGTLTEAAPKVKDIIPFDGNDPDEMLRIAACLEEHFPHSVANAVVQEAKERGLAHEEMHSKVEYVVAHGIVTKVGRKRAIIGSHHFVFEDEKVKVSEDDRRILDSLPEEYSHLYLAIGGRLSAAILIDDPVKEDASEAIENLRREGFSKIVMMTGDGKKTAGLVAKRVGIREYMAEVLPEDKADYIKKLKAEGHQVVMVGDGINDSPALSESDCGIAISDGAAIAREIADVTIQSDDLESLVVLRRLGKALMKRVDNNYRFIVGINSALIALGAAGILPAGTTALLHNGSTIGISTASMRNLLE